MQFKYANDLEDFIIEVLGVPGVQQQLQVETTFEVKISQAKTVCFSTCMMTKNQQPGRELSTFLLLQQYTYLFCVFLSNSDRQPEGIDESKAGRKVAIYTVNASSFAASRFLLILDHEQPNSWGNDSL